MRIRKFNSVLTLGLLWANLALGVTVGTKADSPNQPPDKAQVTAALANLAVPFEANVGQVDPQVAFQARTLAGPLFVTKSGELIWSLGGKARHSQLPSQSQQPDTEAAPGWTVVERFHNGQPQPTGDNPQTTKVSYFRGNDSSKWQQGIPTFAQVNLGSVWPGIAVSLSARGKNVEKLFTLAPGADPNAIQLTVAGGNLAINAAGSLEVSHANQPIVSFTPPVAWQVNADGSQQPVAVTYRLVATSPGQYGFSLASYDPQRPVFIDPLLQSTYLGGTNEDEIQAIAVTSDAVYVAGYTWSTNFPGTSGGAQPNYGGSNFYSDDYYGDGMVAKLNLGLTSLLQSSYLGGTGGDRICAIAVTNAAVYVAGHTVSTDFPGTSTGTQPSNSGDGDGMVAKLNLGLTSILQSSYLGGTSGDSIQAMAVTNAAVYVAGYTGSTNFPGTSSGAQPTPGGGGDGMVATLNLDLTSLLQSTYLGGTDFDGISAIAVTSDAVYVAGYTWSDDFPGTSAGAQPSYGGYGDGIVAKFNLGLTSVLQSSYLGGNGYDYIYTMAVTNDAVYVAGSAESNNFPGTSAGAQPNPGGGDDGMVAKLNLELTSLLQSSYLGGSGHDYIHAIAVTNDAVYVAGWTASTNFPGTSGGAQPAYGDRGWGKAFVSMLSTDLGGNAGTNICELCLPSRGGWRAILK
ncbi:hypothetical protein TI04_08870 [Achromatium sp. WMS2]|nr:hypothetical protein TI04_08870 [Achromatium sp. WMS2]